MLTKKWSKKYFYSTTIIFEAFSVSIKMSKDELKDIDVKRCIDEITSILGKLSIQDAAQRRERQKILDDFGVVYKNVFHSWFWADHSKFHVTFTKLISLMDDILQSDPKSFRVLRGYDGPNGVIREWKDCVSDLALKYTRYRDDAQKYMIIKWGVGATVTLAATIPCTSIMSLFQNCLNHFRGSFFTLEKVVEYICSFGYAVLRSRILAVMFIAFLVILIFSCYNNRHNLGQLYTQALEYSRKFFSTPNASAAELHDAVVAFLACNDRLNYSRDDPPIATPIDGQPLPVGINVQLLDALPDLNFQSVGNSVVVSSGLTRIVVQWLRFLFGF